MMNSRTELPTWGDLFSADASQSNLIKSDNSRRPWTNRCVRWPV